MRNTSRRKFLIAAGAAATAAGLAGGFIWRNRPERDERAERAVIPPVHDPGFPNPLRVPGADGMLGGMAIIYFAPHQAA